MSSYTITIAADDPSRTTTTLKVEMNGTAARITELLVRAGDGDGLTAGQVPAVDLDLLLRAVAPATSGQPALTVSPAAVADDASATNGGSVDDAEPVADATAVQPTTATAPSVDEPVTSRPADIGVAAAVPRQASPAKANTTAKRTSRASGAGATRSRAGKGKAAAGAKAKSAAGKATQTPKGGAVGEGRVYRRSPDDLEVVYQQAGSVGAVADHYNVPRHTAQGWISTMRRRQAAPASQ